MNPNLYIKPAREGLIVRDPVTLEPLPAEGAEKPRSSYWMRRLRDGDVTETRPPKKQSARKSEES